MGSAWVVHLGGTLWCSLLVGGWWLECSWNGCIACRLHLFWPVGGRFHNTSRRHFLYICLTPSTPPPPAAPTPALAPALCQVPYVESSFWNFDALFQPQQHPARDAHDTFFIKQPAAAPSIPAEYMQRVKQTHELGGEGLPAEFAAESRGWRYDWSEEESRKNLLRTHTTAASSRTLYAIADAMRKGGEFRPQKYFSIDRVFRNEALDATHLAEFHQVEGFIIDRDLSLGNLMGTIADFYKRLGPEFSDLKFKPTYNPYTEPSMEFHAYHPGLGKWVEVGNSGVFRPEMLRPMGFPPDVSVIAWGMSLERPTMIKYGFKNIRDLFGHKIDLNLVRSHPIVRWDVDAPAASDDPAAKKASKDLD